LSLKCDTLVSKFGFSNSTCPATARHGSQDPGVEGSAYGKVSMLDNTNGGYT
jgi:hypothetical protein